MPFRPIKPPVLIPKDYLSEIEMSTKAELIDICWDYAMQIARAEHPVFYMDLPELEKIALFEFRKRRKSVEDRRRKVHQAKGRK